MTTRSGSYIFHWVQRADEQGWQWRKGHEISGTFRSFYVCAQDAMFHGLDMTLLPTGTMIEDLIDAKSRTADLG